MALAVDKKILALLETCLRSCNTSSFLLDCEQNVLCIIPLRSWQVATMTVDFLSQFLGRESGILCKGCQQAANIHHQSF